MPFTVFSKKKNESIVLFTLFVVNVSLMKWYSVCQVTAISIISGLRKGIQFVSFPPFRS
jgi:hypothetical protein